MTRTVRAALLAALVATTAIGCSSSRDSDQACWDALTADPAPTGKPEICAGVPDDDYAVLERLAGIERDGLQAELDTLLDEDGG
ncbi:hypothetical protein [Streptomyces bohaiensis]|uniref:hypothetical protein n=1 Tax=Streptomyces bohaiensis TaxID=1431344 RepID=UPI003B818B25